MKTIPGKVGNYLFFKTADGSYHTFLEVEAKTAARDCGARDKRSNDEAKNTREMCKEVWDKKQK